MALRASALLLSLLLHGWALNAIVQRVEPQRIDAFDVGLGQDVLLEPQGMAISELTNVGDAAQSIEAQEVVAVDQQFAAPLPPAPIEKIDETVEAADAPTIAQLSEVEALKPPDAEPGPVAAQPVRDVIASEQGLSVMQPEEAAAPALDAVAESADIPVKTPAPPDEISAADAASRLTSAPPEPIAEPEIAIADAPPAPDEVDRPPTVEVRQPPPERIREPAPDDVAVPPPQSEIERPTTIVAQQPPPPEEIEETLPEEIQLVALPDQVAIVTELSSGEQKAGGDASIVGAYLGQIHDEVQRSKVNPRSRSTGAVIIRFRVGVDGALLSREIASTSGVRVLDDAAIAAIDRAAPFPPIPPEVSDQPLTLTQPFKFVVR